MTFKIRIATTFLTFSVLMLGFSYQSKAITSDYDNLGTFSTSSLSIDGVTITGSDDISVDFIGLGIVGGQSDFAIDSQGAEFIDFSFSAPALNISYRVVTASTIGNPIVGERFLEAFTVGGASLGSIAQDSTGFFAVSTLFGDVAIESFRLSADTNANDSFRVFSLTFDSTASVVPVPAALPLFGTGLAVMGFIGWRRKRKLA